MNQVDHLVSLRDAGRVLGVSPQTLRRWHREQRFRLVRLPNGTLRFRVADLNRLTECDRDA